MKDEIASLHGDLRLMERAQEFDKTMTEMWDEGIPCEVKHHGYDEARVYPEHEVVMLMEDRTVVTLLDTPQLELSLSGDDLQEYLSRSNEQ